MVAVPKATMYEDCAAQFLENKIRATGQVLRVKPIAISEGGDNLSHRELRSRIFRPYAGHDL
jgi:hypothetical protein